MMVYSDYLSAVIQRYLLAREMIKNVKKRLSKVGIGINLLEQISRNTNHSVKNAYSEKTGRLTMNTFCITLQIFIVRNRKMSNVRRRGQKLVENTRQVEDKEVDFKQQQAE